MTESEYINKKINKPIIWWKFYIISLILFINLGVSYIIRMDNFFYIENYNPIGYSYGYTMSAVILLLLIWASLEIEFLKNNPVYAILILGGVFSNFIEKLFFDSVADYIILSYLLVNLADLQIFVGVIMLNLKVWFNFNLYKLINKYLSIKNPATID